jgi:MFS superfamily sulfate permease-like transporter
VPAFPTAGLAAWQSLLPLGVSLFVLSYVESISTARHLASKRREAVWPDQELLATGASNLASGLLGGMAVGASFPRSVANEETARTQLAGVVSGALILCVALFFTWVFRNLPEAVLAAAILHHATKLVNVGALRRIYAFSRRELIIALLTLVGVLVFGLLWGVVIGVVLTVLDALERVNRPYAAVLGRDPASGRFDDVRDGPQYQPIEGVLIMRIEASIFFGNAGSLRNEVLARVRSQQPPIRLLVLDLETCPFVDVSGADMLDELYEALQAEGITLKVADAKATVRRFLQVEGAEKFGTLARDVAGAIADWRRGTPQPA